jgi:hypothetical protein
MAPVKLIDLTKGFFAKVDDEDYGRAIAHPWRAVKSPTHERWYAVASINGKTTYLHRFVLKVVGKLHVDHRDGDGLNCQRYNLRPCTRSQNMANRTHAPRNATGYFGVTKHRKKWTAMVKVEGRTLYGGSHATPEAAARARDALAKKHFGEFARLNFPD